MVCTTGYHTPLLRSESQVIDKEFGWQVLPAGQDFRATLEPPRNNYPLNDAAFPIRLLPWVALREKAPRCFQRKSAADVRPMEPSRSAEKSLELGHMSGAPKPIVLQPMQAQIVEFGPVR